MRQPPPGRRRDRPGPVPGLRQDPRRPPRRLRAQRTEPPVRADRPVQRPGRGRDAARRSPSATTGCPTATGGSGRGGCWPRSPTARRSTPDSATSWTSPTGRSPATPGPVKNPANTHIIEHAGRRLALWEGGLPTEVTPALDTVGEHDFGGRLRGAMTAHPRLDPRTGEMLMFGYSLFEPYLRYHVVDADGTLSHSVDIDLPGAGDDARHGDDRAPRGVPGLALRVRHRQPGQRPDGPLDAGERRPHRGHAPAGHRGGPPVVRDRTRPRAALLVGMGRRGPGGVPRLPLRRRRTSGSTTPRRWTSDPPGT